MIRRLKIHGFQSHESTDLAFHHGINVVVGASDSGKTAIQRALYWLIENRPLGTSIVSDWRLSKKGKIDGETSVEVTLDSGRTVERVRSEIENIYRLDGKTIFEAVRSEVPQQISDLLSLSEVNIQRQLDSPFLLGDTAGDVSRFFNRVVRLELIDRVLSATAGEKRSLQGDIDRLTRDIAGKEVQIANLSWVDDAELWLKRADTIDDRLQSIRSILQKMLDSRDTFDTAKASFDDADESIIIEGHLAVIDSLLTRREKTIAVEGALNASRTKYISAQTVYASLTGFLDGVAPLIGIIETLSSELEAILEAKAAISESRARYSVSERRGKAASDFMSSISPIINRIDDYYQRRIDIQHMIEEMRRSETVYRMAVSVNKEMAEEIVVISHEFPSICPICGAPIEGGRYVSR